MEEGGGEPLGIDHVVQRGGEEHAHKETEGDFPADGAACGEIRSADEQCARLRSAQPADLVAEEKVGQVDVADRSGSEIFEPHQRIDEAGVELHGVRVHERGPRDVQHGPADERGVDSVGSQPAEGHLAEANRQCCPEHNQPPRGVGGQQEREQQAGNRSGKIVHTDILAHDLLTERLGGDPGHHRQCHNPRRRDAPVPHRHERRRSQCQQHRVARFLHRPPAVPERRRAHRQQYRLLIRLRHRPYPPESFPLASPGSTPLLSKTVVRGAGAVWKSVPVWSASGREWFSYALSKCNR